MEIFAIIIAAIVGWQVGRLGRREAKGIAVVAGGWSAVTLAATVMGLLVIGIIWLVIYRAALVAIPFALGVMAKQLWRRRR